VGESSRQLDLGVPDEKETMVARMLFASQPTLPSWQWSLRGSSSNYSGKNLKNLKLTDHMVSA
jgi:hypothetical protein